MCKLQIESATSSATYEEPESEFRKRIRWACERFFDISTSAMTEEQARDVITRIVYWTDENGTDHEKLVYVAIAGAISEVVLGN